MPQVAVKINAMRAIGIEVLNRGGPTVALPTHTVLEAPGSLKWTRPLLLISGVIFTFEAVPEPYRGWLWYNPLIHVVGLLRAGFYPGYNAFYASPVYVCTVAIGVGFFGLLFLRRYHRDIMEL